MNADRPFKIAIIGFGHVGQKVVEILTKEKSDFPNLSADDLTIVGIFTKTRGSVINPDGINLIQAMNSFRAKNRFSSDDSGYVDFTSAEAVEKLEYDILLELSTLNIGEHGEPALSYIRKALQRKKHVVTANKGPLAFAYQELYELSVVNHCQFRFQSTVMDGVPVFSPFIADIPACRINSLSGILNSTTNFILDALEAGQSMKQAIKEAQRRGFAEADPAYDINGWDGAAKICVLVRTLMNIAINPYEVKREPLTSVDLDTYQKSISGKSKLKYICRADRKGNTVRAQITPEPVPAGSVFAGIKDSGNALKIETDGMAPIYIIQEAPTLYDTAFGVLNDIMAITKK